MSFVGKMSAVEPDRAALVRFARHLLASRKNRNRQFDNIEFGEPAWDLMLDLYVSQAEGRQLSVSSLGIGAGMAATTAIRWIIALEHLGHLKRQRDPRDGRRILVKMAPKSMTAMERCLVEMWSQALRALA